jgi:hypothetical protein
MCLLCEYVCAGVVGIDTAITAEADRSAAVLNDRLIDALDRSIAGGCDKSRSKRLLIH